MSAAEYFESKKIKLNFLNNALLLFKHSFKKEIAQNLFKHCLNQEKSFKFVQTMFEQASSLLFSSHKQ